MHFPPCYGAGAPIVSGFKRSRKRKIESYTVPIDAAVSVFGSGFAAVDGRRCDTVYLAAIGSIIKIGRSWNPRARARSLGVQVHSTWLRHVAGDTSRVTVIGVDGTSPQHETFLHKALGTERITGEWYRSDGVVGDAFRDLLTVATAATGGAA